VLNVARYQSKEEEIEYDLAEHVKDGCFADDSYENYSPEDRNRSSP
jgi:hypothetical protein